MDKNTITENKDIYDFLTYDQKKKNDYEFIDNHIKMITHHYPVDYLAKTKEQIKANYLIGNGLSPLTSTSSFHPNLSLQNNSKDSVASTIQYYDIQRRILTRMWGENQKRSLSIRAIDGSGYNQNVRKKKRLELFQEYIRMSIFEPTREQVTQEIMMKYQVQNPSDLSPEDQQQLQLEVDQNLKFKLPTDIDRYMRNSYVSPSEAQLQKLADWAIREFSVKYITSECYKDLTLAGFEAAYIGIKNNIPVTEQVNPYYFTFYNPTSSPFIEDSDWWMYDKPVTFSQLVRDHLNTTEKVKKFKDFVDSYDFSRIASGRASYGAERAIWGNVVVPSMFLDDKGNMTQSLPDVSTPEGQKFYERVETIFGSSSPDHKNMYSARHIVFTSFDKLYYVEREDPKNRTRLKGFWVGENYKKNDKLDIRVTEQWFPALYEGVELGDGTGYITNKQRVPFQNRSVNDPRKLYAPYIGVEFSKLHGNTPRIAPVDLGKPYSYKNNLLENKIEELDESNMGRIFTFANEAIPAGWTIEQMMEVAKKSKMVPIDLSRLGELGFSQVASQLFKSVDVSNDDYINSYIQRKKLLEQECMEAMSYTPSQMGLAPASMTATNNQQNIIQGSYATEDINSIHRLFEERYIEAFVNLIRNGLRDNDHLRTYLLDDLGIAELEVDEETLNLSDIGIKITSALDDIQDINSIKQLLQPMIQNQLIDFSDVAEVQFAKEPSKIINLARESKERLEKQREEQQKQAQEMEMQKLKQIDERNKLELAWKEREFELKELQIRMSGDQFRLQADSDNNKIPDTVQKSIIDNESKERIHQLQTETDKELKIMELELELEKLRTEKELKQKELDIKEKDVKVKAAVKKN